MNRISTIIGLFALAMGLAGIIPLLGWLNWIVLFLAFVGMIFGLSSEDKTNGVTINFLVMVFAVLRLYVYGGIV